MAGLRAIGMVFGLLYLLFIIIVGGGLTWVSMKAPGEIAEISNSSDLSDEARAEARAAREERMRARFREYESEYRHAREGVQIDSDSAAPMVDVERR